MQATTEQAFRAAVAEIAGERDDWTSPEQGWPWPWDNSRTTDYTYAFVDGETVAYEWGRGAEWPDMRGRKNVTFGKRSGTITLQ